MSSPAPAKKSQPKKMALAKEEWDFTACPPEQLKWCDVYEHMRHDTGFLPEVDYLRSNGRWSATAFQRFWSAEHAEIAKAFFTLFPEFPAKPFLRIDQASRIERCEQMDEHRKQAFFNKTITTY
ncbi:hypothetical protein [Prosthecobacter sp.]|jgi:hypothetical protein|uniref:hypothetical protein n=1 Tax=Prosthecobacter sp. TaxID=1965333 RepID=UPI0037CAE99A